MKKLPKETAHVTSPNDLEVSRLQENLKEAKAIAFTALRANGELGVVINFLEKSFSCKTNVAVGQQIFKAMRTFGLSSAVQIRIDSGAINICDQKFNGQAQEFQFLSRLKDKGRVFDFGEHTIINYNHVSLIVRNMPLDQPDRHGRIKDNLAVLLNGAEARISAIEAGAEADRVKSDFLANMSHELRTPMHAILSFSNMGHSRLHKVELEKLGHYFDRIRTSGNRLLLLLNDVLNLSKLESGKMEFRMQQGNLVDIIRRATQEVETLISDRELTVVIEPTHLNTTTYFDEEKILQVLINLLSNAIKFTPVGKQITIFFDPHVSAQPKASEPQQDLLTVVVDDQGIGIPQAEENTIFDKFIQSSLTNTGAGGTGLGLSIVKEIVSAHNGYIVASGNPDGGARFRFSLPLLTEQNMENNPDQEPDVDFF